MSDPIIRSARILLATSNAGKISELSVLLAPHGIEVLSPRDVGLELSVDETGSTFAENAVLKADAYSRAAGMVAVADDSGLAVDALDGRPGIYSARLGGPGTDDARRIELVLDELDRTDRNNRRARFIAAVALAKPRTRTVTFEGRVEGAISREPRGSNGFGYDPIFIYSPARATFAELSPREKGLVSHRARATARLLGYLRGTPAASNAPYTWPG